MNGIGLSLPKQDIGGTQAVEELPPAIAQYSLTRLTANSQNAVKVRRSSDNVEKIFGFLPGMPTNRVTNIIQNGNFRLLDSNDKPYNISCQGCTHAIENGILTMQGDGTNSVIGLYYNNPLMADTVGRRIFSRARLRTYRRNLLHITPGTYTLNGVTAVVDSIGTITLNGTKLGGSYAFMHELIKAEIFDGVTPYTLSVSHVSGTLDGTIGVMLTSSDGAQTGNLLVNYPVGVNSVTSTPVNGSIASDLRIFTTPAATFTNYVIKVQLEQGAVATEWDMWRARPTAFNFVIYADGSGKTEIPMDILSDSYYHTGSKMGEITSDKANHRLVTKIGIEVTYESTSDAATALIAHDGTGENGVVMIDMGYNASNPYHNYTLEQMNTTFPNYVYPFGYQPGELDVAELTLWANGSHAYVTTYYDQKATHDLVQATASKQPQIVFSGTVLNVLFFDGVDDQLTTGPGLVNGLQYYTIAISHKTLEYGGTGRRLLSVGNSSENLGTPLCLLQSSNNVIYYTAGNNMTATNVLDEYFQKLTAMQGEGNLKILINDVQHDIRMVSTNAVSTTYPVRISGHISGEYWYGYIRSISFYGNYVTGLDPLIKVNEPIVSDAKDQPLEKVKDGAVGAWGLTQLNSTVTSMTNEGENLYVGSETFPGLYGYPWTGLSYLIDKNFYRTNISSVTVEVLSGTEVPIISGKYYTVSFTYRTDSTDMVVKYNFHNPGVQNYSVIPTITDNGDGTFKAVATMQCNFNKLRSPDFSIIHTTGTYFDVKDFKIEEGQIATSWCPNQSDIKGAIRVQRKDGTKKDIAYKNSVIDYETLRDFCESAEARVCRIYDWSGYHNHFVQDSWVNMPSIYDQRLLGGMRFNGVRLNQRLAYGNFPNNIQDGWSNGGCSWGMSSRIVSLTGNNGGTLMHMYHNSIGNTSSLSERRLYIARVKWQSGTQPVTLFVTGSGTNSTHTATIRNPIQGQWYILCGVRNDEQVGTPMSMSVGATYATSNTGSVVQVDANFGCMLFSLGASANTMYNLPASFWSSAITAYTPYNTTTTAYHSFMTARNSTSLAALNSMSFLMSFTPDTGSNVDYARYIGKGATDVAQSGVSGWWINRNALTDRGDFRCDIASPLRYNSVSYQSNVFDAGHSLLYTLDRANNNLKCYNDWVKITATYIDSGGGTSSGNYFDLGSGSLANSYPLTLGGNENPGSMFFNTLVLYNRSITDDERILLKDAVF